MPRSTDDADAPVVTVPPQHFERLYRAADDPWKFRTSWYEQRKYAITVASLPRRRYRSGFEAGCSIGAMSKLLAPRCERLLAIDGSRRAVEQAARELIEFDHVVVRRAVLPADLPAGPFDLIIASEVLYYFSADHLTRVLDGFVRALERGGDLVVAHRRASDRAYGYDGFNVHDTLRRRRGITSLVRHEDEDFAVDVFRRDSDGD